MTDLLLFLILVAQIALIFAVNELRKQVEKANDFSDEDNEMKEATEEIRQARERLPRQN